ncbi:hypothetical protein LXA53_17660, partial [Erwinia amylovora]|uniref:hypothetical protein n=1 Tax=Erwinia amylovora TaxID=552 RepID=UPI0020BF5B7A
SSCSATATRSAQTSGGSASQTKYDAGCVDQRQANQRLAGTRLAPVGEKEAYVENALRNLRPPLPG